MDLQQCQQQISITFQQLSYSVTKGRGKKRITYNILKNINGQLHPGRLTAVIGPSRAGKSTILNVLSGFKTTGATGSILVNGKERNVVQFRKLSSYITQDFAMLSSLTTRETLMTAADLKLGRNVDKGTKRAMVDEILHLLELFKTKDTLAGSLSGGEKKRLSIGVELISNPPVMFLDEPTSGLDSSASIQMISHLKSLAQAQRTIVCSIHQPSSEIFEMFDDVLILSEGQCIYNGPLNEMTTLLHEEGFTCPRYYNRADFAIEVASKERGEETERLVTRSDNEFAKQNQLANFTITEQTMNLEERSATRICMPLPNVRVISESLVSSFSQFIILTKRSLLCTCRDIYLTQVRIIIHIVIGLLLGILCYDIGNDASKIISNIASLYFVVFFLFMLSPIIVALTFPMEVSVFLREHKNNWYSLKSYYFSKFVADLPLQIVCPTALLLGYYILTNQPFDGMRFQKCWLMCILWTINSQAMGLAAGAAFSPQMGFFVLFSITMPLSLFSGFLIRYRDVPRFLNWLTDISFYRYAFEGLMVSIYGDRKHLACVELYCHFRSPSKVLEEFEMQNARFEVDCMAVALWIIIFQIIFYCVLKWRVYSSH